MTWRDALSGLELVPGLGMAVPRPGAGLARPRSVTRAVPPPAVTWATPAQVADFVREPPATAQDNRELVAATDAANQWCWRRRQTAGYLDPDPLVSPSADVTRAVVIYAGVLYREGGAADGFASFAELAPGTFVPAGTMGQVNRLLGIDRPRVG